VTVLGTHEDEDEGGGRDTVQCFTETRDDISALRNLSSIGLWTLSTRTSHLPIIKSYMT
jgi:hypothetical protein